MIAFMAVIRLPEDIDQEFIAMIPEQRAHVDRLMAEGAVMSYALSGDRSLLWVTLVAETAEHAEAIISAFPLSRYMNAEIHPLMFVNQGSFWRPQLSLN